MKHNFTEWAKDDKFGDRDYMGEHFYSEDEALRIVKQGGAVSTSIDWLDTAEKVIQFFV